MCTYQAASEEHHRDRHVLEIASGPFFTVRSQAFQEDVRWSVEEYQELFDEFRSHTVSRAYVPRPTEIRKSSKVTTKSEETVPEEDPTLNEMGKTAEDIGAFEKSSICHTTRSHRYEPENKDRPISETVQQLQVPHASTMSDSRELRG
jgi:hypothetical protein